MKRTITAKKLTPAIGITIAFTLAATWGCSSKDDAPGGDPPKVMFNGGYSTTDQSAPIKQFVFHDLTHYTLFPRVCPDGEDACAEEGTYVLDAAQRELVLTSASGTVTKYPVRVAKATPLRGGTFAGGATTQALHALDDGLVGDPVPLLDGGTDGDPSWVSQGIEGLVTLLQVLGEGGKNWLFGMDDGEAIGAKPSGSASKYPFVLASGIMTSPTVNNFLGVPSAFEQDGHHVVVADMPPFEATEARAAALKAAVDRALSTYGAAKVNIIAHSSGGTDSRYLASPEGLAYGDRIASITTISTAHRGTPAAQWVLTTLGSPENGTDYPFLDFLASKVGGMTHLKDDNADVVAMFQTIIPDNAASFNARYSDAPGVYYQSWAGIATVGGSIGGDGRAACGSFYGEVEQGGMLSPVTAFTAGVIDKTGQVNDGMVPVASAKWGEFRGCVPADHLHEVGDSKQVSAVDAKSNFDHVRFYRQVAFELAGRGY